MDPAPKTLVDIASVSRRVFDALVKYAGHKTVESFQLEKIVVTSGAILETLNKAFLLRSGTVDDRISDWLKGNDPETCLDILNRMEALLRPKLDPGYGVKRLFQSSRSLSTKDQNIEALRHFWKHESCFHFLLSTEIWNQESGTQQRVLGAPPSDALHVHDAVPKQDLHRVTQHKSGDPSNVAQEKKTRKQGVFTKKQNSIVRRLGAWSCKDIHGRTIRLRQPDTCVWLPNTNAYKTWRNTENAFLWLHGKAGAGKSVLTASVIDDLKSSLQDGEVLAYFYCDFRNERSTSATEVTRSLFSQLLRQFRSHIADPASGDLIDELAKEEGEMVSASAWNFASYVSRMARCFSRQPFLVLDALDECNDIEELLNALMEFNKGGIRLFVTSRPLQVIKDKFSGLPSIDMDTMKYEVSMDIRLHVIRELDTHRRLCIMDASLKNEAYSVLCEKADGMFRWVQCQLSALKECVTALQFREALYDLPSNLYETYDRILLKISGDQRGGKVARRALDWLVVALKPLQLSQIMEALSIGLDQRVPSLDRNSGPIHGSPLLDVLGSLVTHNQMTDVVILSHYSVKEYLTAESTRAKHPAYHVNEQAAHTQVALLCMRYISVYLERGRHSDNQEVSCQSTRNTRTRLNDSSVAAPSMKRYRSPPPSSEFHLLDEYVLRYGFLHLAHINPGNKMVLRAIEALHWNAKQHSSEWDQLCRRSNYMSGPWPTLKHDFVLYILIAFAPEPFLRLFLGHTKLKLKDRTNPLIYAAYFGKIEHARTMLSRGVKLNRCGWDVGPSRGQALPLEVAVHHRHYEMVNLFLAEGSSVPHALFTKALRSNPPARIVTRLLQTDEFTEWAADAQDQALLLRTLDPTRYLYSKFARFSEQDADTIERRLVQLGYDPSTRFNETFLRDAVSAGHLSTVEHMLSLNIPLPPDIILDASRSPTSNTGMIHLCLSRGSDIHAVSSTEDTALHLALISSISEDDSSENVQVLIDAGCYPSTCNLAGKTPLHLAVWKGYTSLTESLLRLHEQLPPDIILAASESCKPSMIELLTNKGADVHAIAASGDTALHLVLSSPWTNSEECLACVKVLIGAGCNPCLPNAHGKTPFVVAAENCHLPVVQYLHGTLNPALPLNILFSVIANRPSEATTMIKFLVEKKASIDVTRPNGDTLLHLTMSQFRFGEVECLKRVKTLVSAGCNPRACNLASETPFHIAAKRGYISVMEYLSLSLGISVPSDVMVTLFEGFPPPLAHSHLTTILFLLDKGGDIRTVAKNGDTLLHLAAKLRPEEDALELTKHLVHAGCIPCVSNSRQETPLHVAAQSGFISVVKYLLSLNRTLPSDILLAASTGYSVDVRVIHHLVQEGASVSVATTNGDTPLHLILGVGVQDDRLEHVKILIDAGCDPRARNLAGKTPLHNASMRRSCTVLEYLLSRGVPLPDDILLSSTAMTMPLLLRNGLDLRSVAADQAAELIRLALDDPWRNNPVELARILISHGAGWDPLLKNSAGETVIHAAARNGNIDALKFFLSQNVPLPFDVLLAAVPDVYEPVPVTRFLIREGASVDVAASNGNTPLHLAITKRKFALDEDEEIFIRESWELVEILLNCGADPAARNMDGQTPFDLAKEKGHFFEENFLRLVRNSHAHRLRS